MKNKILHIITGLELGGTETTLKKLAIKQNQCEENDLLIISLRSIGKIGLILKQNGIQVKALNINSIFSLASGIIRLRTEIKNFSPSIVQTWLYHADLIGGLTAYSLGIKKIFWGIRSTDISFSSGLTTIFIQRICVVLSYFIPYKIIVAAEESKKFHINIGYCKKKMIVINNGFEVPSTRIKSRGFNSLNKILGINKNDFILGSVGRYTPVKDHATLISAVSSLFMDYKNLKILLIGHGLDYKNKELIELIKKTGFLERFILLGKRESRFYYSLMNIFCLHSRSEGFPNVLCEALLYNLPCIATNVGDAKKILNQYGFIIQPNNIIELREHIKKIINMDKKEINRLTHGSDRSIIKRFSISSIEKKYKSVYTNS